MCDTTSYVLYFFSFNIFTIQRICIYVLTLGQNSREYGVPNEINDEMMMMMTTKTHLDEKRVRGRGSRGVSFTKAYIGFQNY